MNLGTYKLNVLTRFLIYLTFFYRRLKDLNVVSYNKLVLNKMRDDSFQAGKGKKQKIPPHKPITYADYANDIALLANTPQLSQNPAT